MRASQAIAAIRSIFSSFLPQYRFSIPNRHRSPLAREMTQEQMRLALDVTLIGTWDWLVKKKRVQWNDNHFRLLGYAPKAFEPSFERWRATVHPEDLQRVERALAQAVKKNTDFLEEYRVIHTDGSVHWLLGKGRGILDRHGQVVRMVGVVFDITERKNIAESLRRSEALNHQILEAIPDLLMWLSADGTCIGYAGGTGTSALHTPRQAVGCKPHELLPPPLADQRMATLAEALKTNTIQVYEQQLIIDGKTHHEEVRVVPVAEDQALLIVRNVSDRKQAEQALVESEERYRLVTENMTDLVCLHQPDGRFVYVSPSCHYLLGYSSEELIGKNPYEFFHPDDLDQVQASHQNALTGSPVPNIYRMLTKSGTYQWLETLTKPIFDEAGNLVHLQTTSRDVSERVSFQDQLRHDALHDELTRLPNRNLLRERLELVLKRAKRHPDLQFAVLFLDFDHFKVINDSLGHIVGDQLLITIAKKLIALTREIDLVTRLGGDEFVILLEDIDGPDDAVDVAERILEELQSPLPIDDKEIFISASIGIALGTAHRRHAEELVRDADIAMYRAKANGRAGYAIFDPAMHQQVLQRLELENYLRRALEMQEMVLYYQPILSLSTSQIAGFEVLLRWQHPKLGLVTPDRFVTIAEETGLIVPIGEWILHTACQQLAEWQRRHAAASSLKMAVNLSVKQLKGDILLPQLDDALRQADLTGDSPTLEITENLLVQDIDTTSQLLKQVRARGVRISIDDFGTGYSSLSYLHQLPVDSLKIDRAFISPEATDNRHRTIAEAVVALSNLLGLNAIAEGIETREQLGWLQSLNCEYGQGYLFAKPLPADGSEDLLNKGIST
jgi:diguanylate cyclase (GGDEF)-like protein/PAS domain S-box-containing protein